MANTLVPLLTIVLNLNDIVSKQEKRFSKRKESRNKGRLNKITSQELKSAGSSMDL